MTIILELLSVLLLTDVLITGLNKLSEMSGIIGLLAEKSWIILALIIVVVIPWAFREREGWSWREFGLSLNHLGKYILLGLIGYSLVFPIVTAIFISNPQFDIGVAKAQGFDMERLAHLPLGLLLSLGLVGLPLLTLLGSALPEEFFYRGYMQGLLTRSIGPAWAFLIIAISFSYGHYFAIPGGLGFALRAIPGSLLFGCLYLSTGSIIPGIVAHLLLNVIGGYFTYCYFILGMGPTAGLFAFGIAVSACGWFITRRGLLKDLALGFNSLRQPFWKSWRASLAILAILLLFEHFRTAFGEKLVVLGAVTLTVLFLYLIQIRRDRVTSANEVHDAK